MTQSSLDTPNEPVATELRGAQHLRLSILFAAYAWLAGVLLRIFLYARPTPYGTSFVEHWNHYFFHSLFYNLLGTFALSLPWFCLWIVRFDKPTPYQTKWLVVHCSQLIFLAVSMFADHLDSEIMRFVGVHLTPSLLELYGNMRGGKNIVGGAIATDAGGPFLPLVLLFTVPTIYLWWAYRLLKREQTSNALSPRWSKKKSVLFALLPCAVVFIAMLIPGGKFRMGRTAPYVLTIYKEMLVSSALLQKPKDFELIVQAQQSQWLRTDPSEGWTFNDPEYPLRREPKETKLPAPNEKQNLIFLQLETFRAWESKLMRPNRPDTAIPNIDALAQSERGAYWTRFLSFGPPTVNGFIAGHCGVRPHSRYFVTTRFAYTNLFCLPELLRQNGYRAEYFTGSDPDWDGQTTWLRRWYDDFHYYADADEIDRKVFRRARERIVEMGRSGQPFMATVVSISNHYPFRSREKQFERYKDWNLHHRIDNTMRYTDDVVHEFIESLRKEPWFDNTIIVLFGDHAYNLGEHDNMAGNRNGYHEATWVPLVIYNAPERVGYGAHGEVASIADLTPTLADLMGFQVANPWIGHSLAGGKVQQSFAFAAGGQNFGETPEYSFVRDSVTGELRVFAADDREQQHDLSAEHDKLAHEFLENAKSSTRLNDYLIAAKRVWPASP